MKKLLPGSSLILLLPMMAADAAPLNGIGGGKILETALGLALVLLLIFVLARLLQRVHGSSRASGQSMRIVSSMSLGARERILLLHVADRHILVAATAQSISALHVFEEKVPILEPDESARKSAPNFTDILRGLGSGYPK